MHIFDRLSLGPAAGIAGARPLGNGALVVQARAARAGNVQVYRGDEVARPDLAQVRIYRDPDEIFRPESLRSFGHKPVTLDHPPEAVTPRTWRGVARGHVGDEVVRDGEFVRIPMLLADSAAIAAVQGGRREISVGYTCDLDWTPGTAPDGSPYDARQTQVIVDHVAIVAQGRAGPDCRIGDADRRLAEAEARAQAAETALAPARRRGRGAPRPGAGRGRPRRARRRAGRPGGAGPPDPRRRLRSRRPRPRGDPAPAVAASSARRRPPP